MIRMGSWLTLLLVSPGLLCAHAEQKPHFETHPRQRNIIVIRDLTFSFKPYLGAANQKILEIVSSLGPGDRFLMVDIEPTFSPDKNVRVECIMPGIPDDLWNPAANLFDWKQKQSRLSGIWRTVTLNKERISTYVRGATKSRPGGTNVFATFEYVSKRFAEHNGLDNVTYILSDLAQEVGAVSIDMPPSNSVSFSGVHVHVLFVPWKAKAQWDRKEAAWKSWFVEKGGAMSFEMQEPSESNLQPVLRPSDVPKVVPSPFEARSNDSISPNH